MFVVFYFMLIFMYKFFEDKAGRCEFGLRKNINARRETAYRIYVCK